MKSVPPLTSHLTTTLVLPVLVEAIHLLEEDGDGSENKWEKVLHARLDSFGSATSALEKAQQLLNLPIRRALASAQAYSSQSSE